MGVCVPVYDPNLTFDPLIELRELGVDIMLLKVTVAPRF
jgi:hypothetical protein